MEDDKIVPNDGKGILDKYGMIDNLIKITNLIEVKGVTNCRFLYLLSSGLEVLKNGLMEDEKREMEGKKDG